MFMALDSNKNNISIDDAIKGCAYFCPNCNTKLIIRKGEVNGHCFAHESLINCDSWNKTMTQWHKDWQDMFL